MESSNGGPSPKKARLDVCATQGPRSGESTIPGQEPLLISGYQNATADERAKSMNNFAATVNKLAAAKLADPKQCPSSLKITVPDPGEISVDAMMAVHQAALGRPHPVKGVEPDRIVETYQNTARYPGVQSNILHSVAAHLHDDDLQELQGQAIRIAETHLRNTFLPLLAGAHVPSDRVKAMLEQTYNSLYHPPAPRKLSAEDIHRINEIIAAAQRPPVTPAPIRGPGVVFTPHIMAQKSLAEQSRDAPVPTSRARTATIPSTLDDAVASAESVPNAASSQAGPSHQADATLERSAPPHVEPTAAPTQGSPTVPTIRLSRMATTPTQTPSLDPRRRQISVETASSPAPPIRHTRSPESASAAPAPILSVGSPQPQPHTSSSILDTPRSPPSPTYPIDSADEAAVYAPLMSPRAPTAQMLASAPTQSESSRQSHASVPVLETPHYLQSPTYSNDSADEAAVNALSMSPPRAPTAQTLAPASTVGQTSFLRLIPAISAPVLPVRSSQLGASAAPVSTQASVQGDILPVDSDAPSSTIAIPAPASTVGSVLLPQISQPGTSATAMPAPTSSPGMNRHPGHEKPGGLELDVPAQAAPSGSSSPFLVIPASPVSESVEPFGLTAGVLNVSQKRPTDQFRAVGPKTPAPMLASFAANIEPPRQNAPTPAPIVSSLPFQGAPPLGPPRMLPTPTRLAAAPPLGPPRIPLASSLLVNGSVPTTAPKHGPSRVTSCANMARGPMPGVAQVPRPSATSYRLPPRATLALPRFDQVLLRPSQGLASSFVAGNPELTPTPAPATGWFDFAEESLTPQAYRAVKRPSREPIKLIKLRFKKNKHYLLGPAAKDMSLDPMLQIRATRTDAGIAQARNTRLGVVPEIFALKMPIWNIHGTASCGSVAQGTTAYGSASGGNVALGKTAYGGAPQGLLQPVVYRPGPGQPGFVQSGHVQPGYVQPGHVLQSFTPNSNAYNGVVQND